MTSVSRSLTPLDAALYQQTHRGTRGDVAHYRRVCRGARSVLELGAGGGRLLRELAAPDRDVWGVELEPSLLALAHHELADLPAPVRQRVKLVGGDMVSVRLPRRFERVLLPYNGFFCLLDPASARRCLLNVRRLLAPGGVFALDVWNADFIDGSDALTSAEEEERLRFRHAGRLWHVFERCRRGRGHQRLDVTYRYRAEGAPSREQVLRQRYYTPAELVRLLEAAGLRLRSLRGGFAGRPLTDTSGHVVISATGP